MAGPSSFPDHYQQLGLSPRADAEAIRQAYRRLARRYHPDAAPDNPFAPAQFRALKEAYEVLSVPQRRRRYDEERWLRGIHAAHTQALDAAGLLRDAERLLGHLQTIGPGAVHPQALQNLLLYLLQDRHLAVLAAEAHPETNDRFAENIFQSATYLPLRLLAPVLARLHLVAPLSDALQKQAEAALVRHRHRQRQERLLPWLAVALTLLLCLLVLLGSRR